MAGDDLFDTVEPFLARLDAETHPLAVSGRDLRAAPDAGQRHSCIMLDSGMLFKPDGVTLCCWTPTFMSYDRPPLLSHTALQQLKDLILQRIAAGEHTYCATCPYLSRRPRQDTARLSFFSFGQTTVCNLNCTYCQVRGVGASDDARNVYSLVQAICNDGAAAPQGFDWGGNGEPTLDPDFPNILECMFSFDASGTVYTNSVRHSPAIQDGLQRGLLQIVTSADAGTPETYKAIRRVDAFERFWSTLEHYLASGNAHKVQVKYIVTQDNCAAVDIEGFIERCIRHGVQSVLLSRDMHASSVAETVPRALARLGRELGAQGVAVSFMTGVIGETTMNTVRSLMGQDT